MRTRTKVKLLRIAGLVATLPIAFVLFAVSISIDRGLLGWVVVVVVPLALYGIGVLLLLRGVADRAAESGPGPV